MADIVIWGAIPMTWRVVRLSVADIARGRHVQLQNLFEAAFVATSAPKGAAMFMNRRPEDDYSYYFSPGARRIFGIILAAWSAMECAEPNGEHVALLIGHASARELASL